MKTILSIILLFLLSITGFSTKWTVTNSGNTFVPSTLNIAAGDSVLFTLGSTHNVVEVSQATWDADGNTQLPGGFSLPFGGGLLLPSQLEAGTHYYVCSVHASMGMKGTIIVQSSSGVENNQLQKNISVFPNPAHEVITVTIGNDLVGSQYYVTDQTGKKVSDGTLIFSTNQLDINKLTPGVYLIQVVGQRKSTIKFLKE
jgi:plastocyanin